MKYIRILLVSLFLGPVAAFGASNDFMVAAQLLSAAKNADIQQVQALVNNGANVNYVDSTGLSLVCTALMNKDYRAAQILQMYGADASKCDQQIKGYNSRTKPKESGGLFGGLSSAQNLTLAAAGAAVVVGGVLLLTDVFGGGDGGGGDGFFVGSRPGGDGGSSGGGSTLGFTVPYGPSSESNYVGELNGYSPSKPAEGTSNILYDNFQLMTNSNAENAQISSGQNYLLMMHGYSPFARGYLGLTTLRDQNTGAPISINSALWGRQVGGGRPVNVALVTDNGINAIGDSSLGDRLLPWVDRNGSSADSASSDTVSSKYYNNQLTYNGGAPGSPGSWDNFSTVEDATFDLSGHGTAIHNGYASDRDNLTAKVVGGSTGGYTNADFMGFIPNGQMTIYRTGGGMGFLDLPSGTSALTGSYTMTDGALSASSTITINGTTYTVSAVNGNLFTATNNDNTYIGYILNGKMYFDSDGDGVVDQMFTMTATGNGATGGSITLTQTLQEIDYKNYSALNNALWLWKKGNQDVGRSAPSVIANTSVIDPLRDLLSTPQSQQAATIDNMMYWIGLNGASRAESNFFDYVNQYYNRNNDDGANPSADAESLFRNMGGSSSPLLVFSTGSFETDSSWSGATKSATFENAAPLLWSSLNQLFMSVVAVGLTGDGTDGTTAISGFSPSGKYALSQWSETDATGTHYFKSRKCGIAGRGTGSVDPWCFAAAGVTDELATAAAAGAAAALVSAFGGRYGVFNNRQIFTLLALTADGPYLGTNLSGKAWENENALIGYLQSMYMLPYDEQQRVDAGENYLDVFKEVFGYGLINLERATTPGKSIYYYNGTRIVSASGNAYWRAASATQFRASSAFSPRAVTISAPFYDVLTSFDGSLSLPRVWRNEFTLGTDSARGLYMGDTLGELKTRNDAPRRTQVGNIGFSMAASERAYNDYMNGLDTMTVDYAFGNWKFGAGYQHYFTDGHSRFDGTANPILSLASNAVVSDAEYNFGKWSFGARAFSGAITDEGILENDPTISAQYRPAELGLIQGVQSHVAFRGDKFGVTAAFGNAAETETLLGAQTGGLLNLGAGNTMYVDTELRYTPMDRLTFRLHSTFARTTTSDVSGDYILGLTAIDSDAFAVGVDAGNFSLTVSRPLAVRRGSLTHAYADYRVVDADDGNFALDIVSAYARELELAPEHREVRFAGTYRHNFGEFTDGAIGFIYRVNPNNTREFGNESIFMLKMTHRVGI